MWCIQTLKHYLATKRKTPSYNEFHSFVIVWFIRFPVCVVLENINLIYNDKNQISGSLWWGAWQEIVEGNIFCWWISLVSWLDWWLLNVYILKVLSTVDLFFLQFRCKSYLNKVDFKYEIKEKSKMVSWFWS